MEMTGSGLHRALELTREQEKRAGHRKSSPLLPPQITPDRIDYDVDQCRKHKVLVPEILDAEPNWAAAYRVLRTRMVHRAQSHGWFSIGISSPGQGDGKSVTALNLALNVARAGNHNVFLIDLDLRRPKVWEYLGVTPRREITDFLTGAASPEEVIYSIGIDNLMIAGASVGTGEASELLASPRVMELFSFIRSKAPNPMILVDLPPLLSTDDALIMADKVDACLLVVSERRSRRDGTVKALELLEDFNNLAGIVLNRSKATVSDYYASY